MPPDRERPLSASGRGSRRELLIWLLFSALVWAIKIIYLAEYVRLPFLRGPVYDSVVYLRQAHAVLSGQHGDPSLLAFSPLYGYFLAATGGVSRALVPILLQLVLGYLNLFILYRVVRSRHGAGAGLIAAALYFGYGLLLFFETKLMSETLGLHLAVLAMALFLSPRCTAGELRAAIPCGLLVGLSILARASQLFAAPFFVLCALLPWTRDEDAWRRALRRGLGLAVGLTLIFGARAVVTSRHSGLVVPVILVSQTVQRTTDPGFGDDFASLSRGRSGVNAWDVVDQAEERLRAARSPSSMETPRAEPERRPLWGVNLGGLLRNAPRKLRHALADTEVTYDYGYFGERSECRALNLLPISFGLLLLAGTLGALRCIRDRGSRALLPYLPYFLGSLSTMIVFHFSSRYRLFMAVPLALLGGAGLAWLWPRRTLSGGTRTAALLALIAVAAAAVWSGARTIRRPLREPEIWELRVAQSALSASDRPELARRLQRAVDLLRLAPPGPAGAGALERAHELARAGGVAIPEPRRSGD